MASTIRPWHPGQDDIEALTELLHRAYADLAKQGMRFTATYQDSKTTAHRISKGVCLVLEIDGQIQGTATIWQAKPGDSVPDLYFQPGVAVLGQFGIEPTLQGQGYGKQLYQASEQEAINQGCHTIAIDTSERAIQLIAMYKKWGFEHKGHHQWPAGVNYRSVVMAKKLIP